MADNFQERATDWALTCFGEKVVADRQERAFRFLEEALELVQSAGVTKEEAEKLVNYVFSRPVGDPPQELGGTVVTLAVFAGNLGYNMLAAGDFELGRCIQNTAKIQAKQVSKRLMMGGGSK
jgi:hypothetical protein